MNLELEELYEKYLTIIAECFKNKDFTDLFPYLSKDIVWESNWVIEPREGYDVVVDYYKNKAKQLRNSSWEMHHTLVKTLDPFSEPIKGNVKAGNTTVILAHETGKLMDYVLQISDTGEKSGVIIDIKINEDKLISRIDMCIPSLFKFEKYKELY